MDNGLEASVLTQTQAVFQQNSPWVASLYSPAAQTVTIRNQA